MGRRPRWIRRPGQALARPERARHWRVGLAERLVERTGELRAPAAAGVAAPSPGPVEVKLVATAEATYRNRSPLHLATRENECGCLYSLASIGGWVHHQLWELKTGSEPVAELVLHSAGSTP